MKLILLVVTMMTIFTSCEEIVIAPQEASLENSIDATPDDVILTDGLDPNDHRLFLTAETFDGNLGGLRGADDKWQKAAVAARLTRTYVAVLADSTTHLPERFRGTGAVYNFSSERDKVTISESVGKFKTVIREGLLAG